MNENAELFGMVIALIGVIVGIAIVFAQLRLFSIDRTLKQILVELQLQASVPASRDRKMMFDEIRH